MIQLPQEQSRFPAKEVASSTIFSIFDFWFGEDENNMLGAQGARMYYHDRRLAAARIDQEQHHIYCP